MKIAAYTQIGVTMGEYQEKVEKQLWNMLCSSKIDIGSKEAFRRVFEPIFKIKHKEAVKLVEAPLWSKLYSITRETRDPKELRSQFISLTKFNVGEVTEQIWNIMHLSVTKPCDERAFKEIFGPLFKIDSKRTIKQFDDHLWSALYSIIKKIHDPEEMGKKLKILVQINVKRAAEIIKEIDPEKHQFLQYYKR
jgi:hypothetical protein